MDVGAVFPLSGNPIADLMNKEKGVKIGTKAQGFKINLFHEPGQLYPRRTALGQETTIFQHLLPKRTPVSKKVHFEEPEDKGDLNNHRTRQAPEMPRIISILDEKHGNVGEGAGHRWTAGGPLGHKWSKADNEGTESQVAIVGRKCLDFFWSTVEKVRPQKDQSWREHRMPTRPSSRGTKASRPQKDAKDESEKDAQKDTQNDTQNGTQCNAQSNVQSNVQKNAQSNARPKRLPERCPEQRQSRTRASSRRARR